MKLAAEELRTIDEWADFWRNDIGVNVIPASTRKKETYESWKEWQENPIPENLHKEWKTSGAFDNGIAIILGKVHHNRQKEGLYLIGIDCDNVKAIEEVCSRNGQTVSLSQLGQWTLVEQHKDDPTKAHVLLYSHKPFPKKSSNNNGQLNPKLNANEIPAIEVKGLGSHGILFVTPSIHKNGQPYQIIGTHNPIIVDDFVIHIDNICKKYSIPYLEATDNGNGKALVPIHDLFKSDFTIFAGHNRHEALLRAMESLIARNSGILSLEEIKPLAEQWNQKHCNLPLDNEEFEKQWISATNFIAKNTNGQKQDREEDDNKGSRSAADLLVELAVENTKLFFKDQYSTAYAQNHIGDHDEIIRVESNKFKRYLAKLFYDKKGNKVVNSESITNAIQVLHAKAEYCGQTFPLSLRVAWHNGDIYYDMTNEKWQYVSVSKEDTEGWQLVNPTSIPVFIRYNQTSQVEPDRKYPHDIFDRFLELTNLKETQDRILLKVYIISLFIPDIPHAMLVLHGEKGSAKSTLLALIKLLVDPSKPKLLTIYNEVKEFIQQLAHNYVAYYDNLKDAPQWLSDEACKAVTGVGSTKRKLRSDDDDIVYEYRRCLGFSGINVSLTEPDALDRSMLIELQRIKNENTKQDAEIMAEFLELRPKLLGYIFDVLAKALKIKDTLQLNDLPRMADYAMWGEAIARAMGYKDLEFIHAYYDNIGKQNIEAIESNPVAQAIEKFVASWYVEGKVAFWDGSTTEVYQKLNKVAQTHGIDTGSKSWPKAPNSLTKRLRPILSNLREGLGIHIVISRNTSGKNKNISTIRIWKEPPPPPPPPPEQNHAKNENKIGVGSLESGDITSTRQEVSPPETCEIHAQRPDSGDGGDSGGFAPTLQEGADGINSNVLSNSYVAFDFEWSSPNGASEHTSTSVDNRIKAAAFVDSHGNRTVLHLSDLSTSDNSEAELLRGINRELSKYDLSLGWYSTGIAKYHEDTQEYLDGVDSDLAVLHERCIANDVDSVVDFNNAGIPYIRGQKHIDLHSVYSKPMVQNTIFKNTYRTLKLDEVSKTVLGDLESSGKYKGLTGIDIQKFSVEEMKKYVLRDAELVMQLSKHNDGEVLHAMKAISELTGLDFERVCRTGISAWWAAIFDNIVSSGEFEAPALSLSSYNILKQELPELSYIGGIVIQPKKGLYHNLIVVDVASLYPSMAILHNISFDTVNCECCKEYPESKISIEVTRDCRIEKEYWICRQKAGAFPKKLKVFKEERLRQKKLGSQVKQLALKILINGGYGVFGNRYFKYYDPRVAELVTAYGRYTLTRMQEIATNMGFEVVYGDTDSLFIHYRNYDNNRNTNMQEIISKIQEKCNKHLGIEIEHAKTYQTAIISDKKKHYIGWTGIEGKEPDIIGMEGDKNDRPKWINTVFRQTVYDILVNNNPIVNLKKAVKDLDSGSVNPELLKRSNRLSKNPEEYENENDRKRKIGLAINARKGDVIEYYESDNKEGYSLNPESISARKYKKALWKSVKDILEIAGHDAAAIEQEVISNLKDDHMAKPPRGVVGYAS